MTLSYPPLREPLASEITAALIGLATLTQRAACAAYAQLDAVSYEMLKCVLALCKARRGAVLLTEGQDTARTLKQSAQPLSDQTKAFRVLALHNMQVAEA